MSLNSRERDIRAVVGEHVPGEIQAWFTSVMCDGCFRIAAAADAEALQPLIDGWAIADELGGPDYCPDCKP